MSLEMFGGNFHNRNFILNPSLMAIILKRNDVLSNDLLKNAWLKNRKIS